MRKKEEGSGEDLVCEETLESLCFVREGLALSFFSLCISAMHMHVYDQG